MPRLRCSLLVIAGAIGSVSVPARGVSKVRVAVDCSGNRRGAERFSSSSVLALLGRAEGEPPRR
ncbi:DUF5955 family protein [Streptomyces sp. NPDC054833]